MSGKQQAQLDAEVFLGIYPTVGKVASCIEKAFGIKYCERAVGAVLHKLDFVHKKTSDVPPVT